MSKQYDESLEIEEGSPLFPQADSHQEGNSFNPDKIVVRTAKGTVEVDIPVKRSSSSGDRREASGAWST